jgi:hypothetical protein
MSTKKKIRAIENHSNIIALLRRIFLTGNYVLASITDSIIHQCVTQVMPWPVLFLSFFFFLQKYNREKNDDMHIYMQLSIINTR